MVVSYSVNQAEFVPSKPRLWAATKDFGFFDIAPDGKRIALTVNEESNQKEPKGPTQVTFVLNFFDELRRRQDRTGHQHHSCGTMRLLFGGLCFRLLFRELDRHRLLFA